MNKYLNINPFAPNAPFLYPLKGGREKVHLEKMD